MERNSFVFYKSFYEALKGIDPLTKVAIYDVLINYALYEIEPVDLDPICFAVFQLMRQKVDANNNKRDNARKDVKKGNVMSENITSDLQTETNENKEEQTETSEKENKTNENKEKQKFEEKEQKKNEKEEEKEKCPKDREEEKEKIRKEKEVEFSDFSNEKSLSKSQNLDFDASAEADYEDEILEVFGIENTPANQEPVKSESESTSKNVDVIREYFNLAVKNCIIPQIRGVSGKRLAAVKARIREYGLEDVKRVIDNAAASDFLNGKNRHSFVASFDWLFRHNNFPKVLEGNYNDRPAIQSQQQNTQSYEDRQSQQRRNDVVNLIAKLRSENTPYDGLPNG